MLAGGIAHDFNNLLLVSLRHTELALAEVPADSRMHHHLRRFFEFTRRAAELSRQVLAYSGRQPLALEPLSLSGLVREAAPMLEGSSLRRGNSSIAPTNSAMPAPVIRGL